MQLAKAEIIYANYRIAELLFLANAGRVLEFLDTRNAEVTVDQETSIGIRHIQGLIVRTSLPSA